MKHIFPIDAKMATPSRPARISDEMPFSPNSSSTSNARLTPESDPEDSDLDMGEVGEVGETFKLQHRPRDMEKGDTVGIEEENDEEEYHYQVGRRVSVSTMHSFQLYTPDEERAVVKKFDRKLVFFVALLYMLSFLDRSSTCAIAQQSTTDRYRHRKCQDCRP